ncbi:type I restriction endonuclease [Stenotrophomonas sp. PS02289]|uniref:type I restriction endonuclease n=1 Tax=Stenotrophomonas sp. PS02289 TaxID=2991422 RepID=UPI002499FDCA|nr:type I restriction endonuclease [Stenotrophomonas sp. PS02289]
MTGPRHEDAVRRSALAWLKRLGWNYVAPDHYAALKGHPESVLLGDRLRAIVRRCRHLHAGRHLVLSDEKVDAILRTVADAHAGATWPAASAATLRLLQSGIRVDLPLPGGGHVTRTIPLIDWDHPNRNHWDVADDLRVSGGSRAVGVRDLICYVNGIPLVLIACVERDSHRHWARVERGITHLLRGMEAATLEPPPRQAQLLISLDRREARFAGIGAAVHAWTRWRETHWDRSVLGRLRAMPIRQHEGPPDVPLAAHAELLGGLLAHDRLLRLLQRYMQAVPHAPVRLARAAQYGGVEAALQHLRAVTRHGRSSDAQVVLSPGCGVQRAREWLAAAIGHDPVLATFRLLIPVRHPSRSRPAWARGVQVTDAETPAQQLRAFFATSAPAPLEICAQALLRWAGIAAAVPHPGAGADVVLLLDADFWTHEASVLSDLRRHLPEATWLTFTSTPVAHRPPAPRPGISIYHYDTVHAVADGVVVPVVADALGCDTPDPTCRVRAIILHYHQKLQLTRRDLRAMVLVSTPQEALAYQRAFEQDGRLRTRMRALDAQGHSIERVPEVPPEGIHLEICCGPVPAQQEARLGVVYVERELDATERDRLIGRINQPHADKHAALLVYGLTNHAALPAQPAHVPSRSRLVATLPDLPWHDFNACLEVVAPRWEITLLGDDRDAHRQRRHLLRRRITQHGLDLQHAAVAMPGMAGDAACSATQLRRELQAYACVDAAAAQVALEERHFGREDTRVRQWLQDTPLGVCEPLLPYTTTTGEGDAARQASQLYAELREALEHPGEEPARAERAGRELQGILLNHADPLTRITALEGLRDRLPAMLGHAGQPPRSRAYLVLEGNLGAGMDATHHAPLIRQMESTIGMAQRFLPREPRVFRQHVRAGLRSLFEQEFGATRAELLLDAIITRAPHWPLPD